jgi:hypothetical protein
MLIEKLEKFLMEETEATIEDIKEAYNDRLYEEENYKTWLLETAKVNGYKEGSGND